jgi:hypothetical protein
MNLKRLFRSAEEYFRFKAFPAASRARVFRQIFLLNKWGSAESVSGPGSTLRATTSVRKEIARIVRDYRCRSILDIPCGDFNWMKDTDLPDVTYIGADIVADIVSRNRELYSSSRRQFLQLDVVSDQLPKADLLICRDLFLHLSFADIQASLHNIRRSGCRLALLSSHPNVTSNTDIHTGGGRPVNICIPPFEFPCPLQVIDENWNDQRGPLYNRAMLLLHVDQWPGEHGIR